MGLFVVVVLALWAVVAYRNHESYNNGWVDAHATRVIKVNLGALTREIGWNAFWNPSFYADGQSNEVMEKKRMTSTGLGSTANVFLFQRDDGPVWANPTFGVLSVSDVDVFTQFLQTELALDIGMDDSGYYGENGLMAIRYNDRQAVFALKGFLQASVQDSTGHTRLMDQLLEYMAGTGLIGIKKSSFSQVVSRSGHLVFVGDEQIAVDFREGEIVFSYSQSSLPSVLRLPVAPETGDSAFVRIKGNIADWLPAGRVFTQGNYNLHGDSLRHYSTGQVVAGWEGMITQMDSVVAWEYDENFEMQETVKMVERATPDFHVSIRTETDKLQRYLLRQGVLDSLSGTINAAFFPLYQVFWKQEDGWLTLKTHNGGVSIDSTGIGRPLYVAADIQAIKKHTSIPKIQQYITPFRSLVLETEGTPDGTVVHGHIKMEDNTVNSLMQMLVRPADDGI